MELFIQGFILQSSLILALGAQNIFVLDSGMRRRKHITVATVSSICDLVLILAGVLGAASLFLMVPLLKVSLGLLGIGFLFSFGIIKLRQALKGSSVDLEQNSKSLSVGGAVLLSLSFSFLNPHALLDTLILIGGYSTRFPVAHDRFLFGLGAGSFSTVWFFGLALMSAQMSRLLSSSKAMRAVAFVSGGILLWLSFQLGAEIFSSYPQI